MIDIAAIDKVFIKLEVNDKLVLSIMLGANGAINRMGDGSDDFSLADLCMGTGFPSAFKDFIQQVDIALFDLVGRYELPNPEGDLCRLSLSFTGHSVDTGFEFLYGADSSGPPEEIIVLVENALDLTDPWYEEQIQRKRSKRN